MCFLRFMIFILFVLQIPIQAYDMQAVIFAAGKSSRFGTKISKLLTPLCGQEIVLYPVKAVAALNIPMIIVVGLGHQHVQIEQTIKAALPHADISFIKQEYQLGTGHALQCTQPNWKANNILVINGDQPLTSSELLQTFIHKHKHAYAKFSLLVSKMDHSCRYGRIATVHGITKIIEAPDFTNDPSDFPFVNAGYYLIDRSFLEHHIDELWLHKNKMEYYITDLIEIASTHQIPINMIEVPFRIIQGINTQEEFKKVEAYLKTLG